MAKPTKKERPIAFTVGVSVAALAVAFLATWLYILYADKTRPAVAYVSFKPVVVRAQTYSISATFALQTSPADAWWVEKNQRQLTEVMKDALNSIDPAIARSPAGLLAVQKSLKDVGNTALKSEKIQQVLFTDFVMQSN